MTFLGLFELFENSLNSLKTSGFHCSLVSPGGRGMKNLTSITLAAQSGKIAGLTATGHISRDKELILSLLLPLLVAFSRRGSGL